MKHGELAPMMVVEDADGEIEILPTDMTAFLLLEQLEDDDGGN